MYSVSSDFPHLMAVVVRDSSLITNIRSDEEASIRSISLGSSTVKKSRHVAASKFLRSLYFPNL